MGNEYYICEFCENQVLDDNNYDECQKCEQSMCYECSYEMCQLFGKTISDGKDDPLQCYECTKDKQKLAVFLEKKVNKYEKYLSVYQQALLKCKTIKLKKFD